MQKPLCLLATCGQLQVPAAITHMLSLRSMAVVTQSNGTVKADTVHRCAAGVHVQAPDIMKTVVYCKQRSLRLRCAGQELSNSAGGQAVNPGVVQQAAAGAVACWHDSCAAQHAACCQTRLVQQRAATACHQLWCRGVEHTWHYGCCCVSRPHDVCMPAAVMCMHPLCACWFGCMSAITPSSTCSSSST